MKFRVSTASKRLVGKLDEGDDLVEVLTSLCEQQDVGAAEIRAVGYFDSIELVHFDGEQGQYVPVVDGEGDFELVSLNGNVSRLGGEVALRLDAVFNVAGPAGPNLVGGQLRRAEAAAGEFVIDTFADLKMQRRLDADSGRLVLDSIDRDGSAPAPTPSTDTVETGAQNQQDDGDDSSSLSWDDAIAEAEQTEQTRKSRRTGGARTRRSSASKSKDHDPYAGFDFDEPLMSKGDLLNHPKLGTCRVLDVEDDQYVKVRLPRGRIRKLATSVLNIEYRGEEEGKKVFDARVKR